mgnify:CR=1 FL=1
MSRGAILIADHDKEEVQLLRKVLESEGYQIFVAESVHACKELVARENIGIVIVEADLIDCHGIFREWRKLSPLLKVLVIEENTSVKSAVNWLRHGADHFVEKPLLKGDLLRALNEIFRDQEHQVTEQMGFTSGPFYVDVEGHRIYKNGDLLALPPTCYGILKILMENEGVAFSHQELAKHVHGEQASQGDLENWSRFHVYRLRRMVECDPKNPKFVKTVRGVGYRFEGSLSE